MASSKPARLNRNSSIKAASVRAGSPHADTQRQRAPATPDRVTPTQPSAIPNASQELVQGTLHVVGTGDARAFARAMRKSATPPLDDRPLPTLSRRCV
jgi:hypothetical protein